MDTIENYQAQVDSDFEEEVRDELHTFEVHVGNMRVDGADKDGMLELFNAGLDRLMNLRNSVDKPLFDLLLRRMENYVGDLSDPTDDQLSDIDVMHGVLDGEIGGEINEAEFFRSLPVRRPADLEDFRALDLEILVVDANKTGARIVQRELVNCGYRVSLANRSFEALELAIRTRPDMIVSSGVLDEMSGVDLGAALAVVQPTETIPFALLTSSNDASLKQLPENAVVIKKGSGFSEGFANAVEKFGIA